MGPGYPELRNTNNIIDEMLTAEKASNNHRGSMRQMDFKRVMRRQGTTVEFMEEFSNGMELFRTMQKCDSSITS